MSQKSLQDKKRRIGKNRENQKNLGFSNQNLAHWAWSGSHTTIRVHISCGVKWWLLCFWGRSNPVCQVLTIMFMLHVGFDRILGWLDHLQPAHQHHVFLRPLPCGWLIGLDAVMGWKFCRPLASAVSCWVKISLFSNYVFLYVYLYFSLYFFPAH